MLVVSLHFKQWQTALEKILWNLNPSKQDLIELYAILNALSMSYSRHRNVK